jgi:hypothetical protein
MNNEERFTEWQRSKLCDVILLGCDRATACDYVGVSPAELQQELERDEKLEREVARAEAQAAVRHMGNVHKAAEDEKNWRTSVWWLERREQARPTGDPYAPSDAHVAELVDELAKIVVAVIVDAEMQQRLIERLLAVVAGVREASESVESGALLPAPREAAQPAAVPAEEERFAHKLHVVSDPDDLSDASMACEGSEKSASETRPTANSYAMPAEEAPKS